MNDVLRRSFACARCHARTAEVARPDRPPSPRRSRPAAADRLGTRWPGIGEQVTVCAFGGAFAGTVDRHRHPVPARAARRRAAARRGRRRRLRVRNRRDRSLARVARSRDSGSWRRISRPSRSRPPARRRRPTASPTVSRSIRDLGLSSRADASASFIALNPPFHTGSAVPRRGVAAPLFAEAGRVLSPGGELWAVWNSPLQYRPALEKLVGPTRQVARNAKFTVTVSTRR